MNHMPDRKKAAAPKDPPPCPSHTFLLMKQAARAFEEHCHQAADTKAKTKPSHC